MSECVCVCVYVCARMSVCVCVSVCAQTLHNYEIPDSEDRVPAWQGREEREEPWHHKVD